MQSSYNPSLNILFQNRKISKKQLPLNEDDKPRQLQKLKLTCAFNLTKIYKRNIESRGQEIHPFAPIWDATMKNREQQDLPLWQIDTQQSLFLATSRDGIHFIPLTLKHSHTTRACKPWKELRDSWDRNLNAPSLYSGSLLKHNQNERHQLFHRQRVGNHRTRWRFRRRTSASRPENLKVATVIESPRSSRDFVPWDVFLCLSIVF